MVGVGSRGYDWVVDGWGSATTAMIARERRLVRWVCIPSVVTSIPTSCPRRKGAANAVNCTSRWKQSAWFDFAHAASDYQQNISSERKKGSLTDGWYQEQGISETETVVGCFPSRGPPSLAVGTDGG